jgi:hypothetical protein
MTSVWISPELTAAESGWLAGLDGAMTVEPAARFVLRRSGGRPLSFSGMLMLEHSDETTEDARRHTIRLYETTAGTVVIEIVLASLDEDRLPHSVTAEVGTLDEVEMFLSSYDPAAEAAATCGSLLDQAVRLETEAGRLRLDFDMCRKAVFAACAANDQDAGFQTRTN